MSSAGERAQASDKSPGTTMSSVWSCYSRVTATSDARLYGDHLGSRYEYDSNVINFRRVAVGDILVIRDSHQIHGYGFVQSIDTRPGTKAMSRCPDCRSADLARRKNLLPAWRCNDCKRTFEEPSVEEKDVLLYSASYEGRWFSLESPITIRALDGVYADRDRQNAIRLLDPTAAQALLRSYSEVEGYLALEIAAHRDGIPGGRVEALVQRRIGQQQFRARLLATFGPTCAVTGEQPETVLDAAHLYSFADHAVHEDGGGLLLRADIHRMFDHLLITFDPRSWRSLVAPPLLQRHAHLQDLDGTPIAVPERLRPQERFIAEHHDASRRKWRDIA